MGTISNGVGAGEKPALHQAERIHPVLTVVPPVVHDFTNQIGKNHRAKRKGDAMLGKVGGILDVVKLDFHGTIYGKPV